MSRTEPIPYITDPGRVLYERAYGQKDELLLACLSLDRIIYDITTAIGKQGWSGELFDRAEVTRQKYLHMVDTFTLESGGSWTDFFHLMSRASLIHETVLAPHVFADLSLHEARKSTSDGVEGIIVETLEKALNMYNTNGLRSTDYSQLKGVINEQTTLGLLNRRQSPSQLALPASRTDDILEGIDAVFWEIRNKQASTSNVQVKSLVLPGQQIVTKNDAVLVHNSHLGHEKGFVTARLLVEECRRGLNEPETEYLDELSQNLVSYVRHRLFVKSSSLKQSS